MKHWLFNHLRVDLAITWSDLSGSGTSELAMIIWLSEYGSLVAVLSIIRLKDTSGSGCQRRFPLSHAHWKTHHPHMTPPDNQSASPKQMPLHRSCLPEHVCLDRCAERMCELRKNDTQAGEPRAPWTREVVMKQHLLGTGDIKTQQEMLYRFFFQHLLEKPERAFLSWGPRRSEDRGVLPVVRGRDRHVLASTKLLFHLPNFMPVYPMSHGRRYRRRGNKFCSFPLTLI